MTLAVSSVLSISAYAAEPCPANSKVVNDSNNLIMLGGTAKGPIRQVVVGEFGKDVNSQKRLLGQFDQCGRLLVAEASYDKNENNVQLNMEQQVMRTPTGWQADYKISVRVNKDNKWVEVTNKQGMVAYQQGKNGNITSASDVFTLMGEKGFTDSTYTYDKQLHLQKSVARGTDHLSNGEYRYKWNARGDLASVTSDKSKDTYSYDKQHRELGLRAVSKTPVSGITAIHECQSWDDMGNCTLSYIQETEVFDSTAIKRNISAASRYEYWNAEKKNK
ncbi:hypothetical protein [Erwinia sp. V71]|uniref:hypothetical protein n=1 Tax=Erwinia sp. V71 TaxID=3369424 RepID=UPI003F638205